MLDSADTAAPSRRTRRSRTRSVCASSTPHASSSSSSTRRTTPRPSPTSASCTTSTPGYHCRRTWRRTRGEPGSNGELMTASTRVPTCRLSGSPPRSAGTTRSRSRPRLRRLCSTAMWGTCLRRVGASPSDEDLSANNRLSPVKSTAVYADLQLGEVEMTPTGEYATASLAQHVNTPSVNLLIVRTYLHRAGESSCRRCIQAGTPLHDILSRC